MVGKQIMEPLGGVVDAVPCIQYELANRPTPDAREMPEPLRRLAFLPGGEPELELPLAYATPVSGFRCTA